MSPSEDDLRRALSDGAGDTPDVDRIVAAAHEQRAGRRRRVLSASAAVIVVGGVAAGGAVLLHDNKNTSPTAQSAEKRTAGEGAGGTNASAASGSKPSGTSTLECPSHVPSLGLPGGGGTTQFGSTGKLFAKPVATVTVCAYPSEASTSDPARVRLNGSAAETFAGSLEDAPKTASRAMCSDLRRADQQTLAIIATSTSGTRLPTVTTTINEPSCAVIVSNGTAARFGWSWPASLRSQLEQVSDSGAATSGVVGANRASTSSTTPGDIDGSPAH